MKRRHFSTAVLATTIAFAAATGVCSAACADDKTESAQDTKHPLTAPLKFAKDTLEKVERLDGYEGTFFKREVVGKSLVSQRMQIKVRHKPFSIYLKFVEPHAGREVIYVDGKNNGKLLAHEAGLFTSLVGVMELAPTDSLVMSENRHPITEAGIANALKMLIDQWEKESKYGEIEVKYYKDAKVGNSTCRIIETIHPTPRKQFDNHKTRLWVDTKTGLPVRFQKFGFPRKRSKEAPILEEYTFVDLKTDVKLSNIDFDRTNPRYKF